MCWGHMVVTHTLHGPNLTSSHSQTGDPALTTWPYLNHSICCLPAHFIATVCKYHSVDGGVPRGGSSGHTPCSAPSPSISAKGGSGFVDALNIIMLAGRMPYFRLGILKFISAVQTFLYSCVHPSCFCNSQDTG